jgi:peroxiredoxin (alkyl hydroperoxide reductase subunit C)
MCGPTPATQTAGAPAQAVRTLPRIGDKAPDFTAQTTHGELSFHKWAENKWVLLFSHPADFTPVCSTELTEFERRREEFDRRGVKMMAISVDSIHSHLAWLQNLYQILKVRPQFPIVADSNRKVAELYGMIHPHESATVTVRALFFIDPKQTIRAIIYYPLNVGRNVDEVLRAVDALQTADTNAVACPVNWKPGDKVIVPPPKSEVEVAQRMALQNVERLDFYLTKKSL